MTRCDALFASHLQASEYPDPRKVRLAVRRTIRALGARGCAAHVAQEFGDHPDTAVTRMGWVKLAVCQAYADTPHTWSIPLHLAPLPAAA